MLRFTHLNRIYCPNKCKTRFNNRKAKKKRLVLQEELKNLRAIEQITKKQNQILWHNRELLKNFEGQEVVIDRLLAEGFKLRNVTKFTKVRKGDKEVDALYVYDFGYYFIDKQKMKIFRS